MGGTPSAISHLEGIPLRASKKEKGEGLPHLFPLSKRLAAMTIFGCYQRCKTDPAQRLKIDPGVNLLL